MKIRAIFIFEVLGRPPEHIVQALEGLINRISEKKSIEIVKKTIHEPKEIEDKNAKGLFTSFAEVEILTEDITDLFFIVLTHLPANVEIIEPHDIILKNFSLAEILTSLTLKLHKYDEVAKVLTIENNNLNNHIKEIEEKYKNISEEKKNKKKNQKEKK